MEQDKLFQWTKLVLDHAWLLFLVAAVIYLLFNPGILRSITRLRIGDFEVQLQEIQKGLAETRETTRQLAASSAQIEARIKQLDMNSPAAQLRKEAGPIKGIASHLSGTELEQGLAGLGPGSGPQALHAAALIARERRDPATLPQLVDCLERIAASPNLMRVRLNTIWYLASATHRTLVAIYKNGAEPVPDLALLQRAEGVLQRLVAHPRIQADRPDDPGKGVRGPAGHALTWIARGMERPKT